MSMSTDEKVSMSLDDLIKKNKGAGKAERNGTAQTRLKKTTGISADARKMQNAATTVGTAKAKRAARVNKSRGLNPSGKASTEQIKQAVAEEKQRVSTTGRKNKHGKPSNPRVSPGAALPPGKNIVIKFSAIQKPTQDKHIGKQVLAAMAKQTAQPMAAPKWQTPRGSVNGTQGGRGGGRGGRGGKGRGRGRN